MATEKRLIDANMLYEKATNAYDSTLCDECYSEIINLIDEAPTVDAVEVVHGRWEKRNKNIWRCSVCKRGVPYSYTGFHYCPNCGAKMDGDGNA